jgi:hypothetical protein
MSRHRKDLKSKIASLSALGAGTLLGGAGGADASTIYSGPIHIDVGANGQSLYTIPLAGPKSYLSFFTGRRTTAAQRSNNLHYRYIRAYGAITPAAKFASSKGVLGLFHAGSVFPGTTGGGSLLVGSRIWRVSADSGLHSSRIAGLSPFSLEYSLFKFTIPATGQTDYGWVQLSYAVGIKPGTGPDLTITGYAWDNSGALLPAGSLTPTPEPSTMGLAGLGALALGAAGLRRWRKSRQAA